VLTNGNGNNIIISQNTLKLENFETDHVSWTENSSKMCPANKAKDAPRSAYNEDQGKFIKLLFNNNMLLSNRKTNIN
jgi:hypothetical protein